jgi:hypothetical protein
MTTLRHTSGSKLRLTLLALLTVATLSVPSSAKAAERDGTVLFFPLKDLQQMIVHPSLNSLTALFSFSSPVPNAAQHLWAATPERDNPLQWYNDYSNGICVDGCRLPGPRPLWGN